MRDGDRVRAGLHAGDGASGRDARDGHRSQPQAGGAASARGGADAAVADGDYGFHRITGRLRRFRFFVAAERD